MAEKYSSIADEALNRGLKLGSRMQDGWVYAGISPTTHTAFAYAPVLAFDGRNVSYRYAIEFRPDRLAAGYKDSAQRCDKDLQDPNKDDDGLATLPSFEEAAIIANNVYDHLVFERRYTPHKRY